MTIEELYHWALEQGLEKEELITYDEGKEKDVEIEHLTVVSYGIII